MRKLVIIATSALATLLLEGCGAAETAGVAAAQAEAAAEQIKQGEELQQKMQDDLAAAQKAAADARDAVEHGTQ
jgi:hypothetical protein